MYKNTLIGIGVALVVVVVAFMVYQSHLQVEAPTVLDSVPKSMTLSGTYVCLPHVYTTGPQTEECAFGIQTDDGEYYAVDFGASAEAMEQFQGGAHVRVEGFVTIKEALGTDQWNKHDMNGIFTVSNVLEVTPPATASGKLNIAEVCQSALSYMSFVDGASADAFVAECEAGNHPEVIERYINDMKHDGATI